MHAPILRPVLLVTPAAILVLAALACGGLPSPSQEPGAAAPAEGAPKGPIGARITPLTHVGTLAEAGLAVDAPPASDIPEGLDLPRESGVYELTRPDDGAAYTVSARRPWSELGLAAPASMVVRLLSFSDEPSDFGTRILELSADGQRVALFTHVHQLVPLGASPRALLVHAVDRDGDAVPYARILDVTDGDLTMLTPDRCTLGRSLAIAEQDRLLTWFPAEIGGGAIDTCLWRLDGTEVGKVIFDDSGLWPDTRPQLLQRDPDTIVLVDSCRATLANLRTGQIRQIQRPADPETGRFCRDSRDNEILSRDLKGATFDTFGEDFSG